MRNKFNIIACCLAILTTSSFIFSLLCMIKNHKRINDSVRLMWIIGFSFCFSAIFTSILKINEEWYAQVFIFFTEYFNGLEHWLLAIEYTAAAHSIKAKLQNVTKVKSDEESFDTQNYQQMYYRIFKIGCVVFFFFEASFCFGEYFWIHS